MQIDKLQVSFRQWGQTPIDIGERVHLINDLITSCESIEWQVLKLRKNLFVCHFHNFSCSFRMMNVHLPSFSIIVNRVNGKGQVHILT